MVDVKIPCIFVIKISNFLYFLINLCAILKIALVICLWLIFKLDFDLDDDLYWIQALAMK